MPAPFPPYAYLPGHRPHPVRDPAGHSFGQSEVLPCPLDLEPAAANLEMDRGVELFDAGYYWEAHEVWEGLWAAEGRSGAVAGFLQGLIKLAVAVLKIRQGHPEVTLRMTEAARRHFREAREAGEPTVVGFALDELVALAGRIGEGAAYLETDPALAVEIVWPEPLASLRLGRRPTSPRGSA